MPPVKLFKVAELPGVETVGVGGLPLSWRGSHTKVERAAISPFEMIICEIALAATKGPRRLPSLHYWEKANADWQLQMSPAPEPRHNHSHLNPHWRFNPPEITYAEILPQRQWERVCVYACVKKQEMEREVQTWRRMLVWIRFLYECNCD